MATLNASEDPREGAGGLGEARVLRGGIDALVLRVLREKVMAGLECCQNLGGMASFVAHTSGSKHEDEKLKGGLER